MKRRIAALLTSVVWLFTVMPVQAEEPTDSFIPETEASAAVTLPEVTDEVGQAPAEEPAAPEEAPVEPEEVPAEPEDIPAEPEVLPAEPEDIPAKPEVLPAEPEDIPAKPEVLPAEPEDIPVVPEEPAEVPFTATVRIELVNQGAVYAGDRVTLRAVVEDASAAYTVVWAYYNENADVEHGEDPWVAFAQGNELSFVADESNATRAYRVTLNDEVVSKVYTLPQLLSREETADEPEEDADPEENTEAEPENPAEPEENTETEPEIPAEPEENTEAEPEIPAEPEENTETEPEIPSDPEENTETEPEIPAEPEENTETEPEESTDVTDEDSETVPATSTDLEEATGDSEAPADPEEDDLPDLTDKLAENGQIEILVQYDGELAYGTEVTFAAVLTGYDDVLYELHWETSVDQQTWEAIPGAIEPTYRTVVSEENCLNSWRVLVTVLGPLTSDVE